MQEMEIRRRSRLAQLWKDGANELAEFAVVLPLLTTVLIGMYWFGRAYNIYETITRASREAAHYGSAPVCALCTQNCGFPGLSTYPCQDDVVNNSVLPALQASHLDPSQIISITGDTKTQPNLGSCFRGSNQVNGCRASGPICAASQNVWICHCVDMNPGADPPECGTWVGFKYPFKFKFPFTGLDGVEIDIPTKVQMREER
jgi:TadE-like protein